MSYASTTAWLIILAGLFMATCLIWNLSMFLRRYILPVLGLTVITLQAQNPPGKALNVSTSWYPPNSTKINDLNSVINATGVYGFIFNNSYISPGNDYYGGYNWCNMPHVNKKSYPTASEEYVLEYVEVVGRFTRL